MRAVIFLLIGLAVTETVLGDTPANCTYGDILGSWDLKEYALSDDCSQAVNGQPERTLRVSLEFPNVAYDRQGNKGFWTIIYNQGFEVVINYRKYFAFSSYVQKGSNVTSFCDQTLPFWSHDILGRNWACYKASKVENMRPKVHVDAHLLGTQEVYVLDKQFIKSINEAQTSWKAKPYLDYHGMSVSHLIRKKGGLASRFHGAPVPAQPSQYVKNASRSLPDEWDWRNISGVNYVSPVRNQGSCGSCYAFSSVGMIEARLRVSTNNQVQDILSPQDIVDCSKYSQGCDGGFPYLIAGKYAQDVGMVDETCNPYQGENRNCSEPKCKRHYVAHYKYVGGFYGGCNEELMKIGLVRNGPMSVSFEVYDDFMHYSGGVYHYTGLSETVNSGFNPFAITNHAVLLVGYGKDAKTGENYWLVKNSWGPEWGESGYFRIRRGTNECNIESIAVEAFPISY